LENLRLAIAASGFLGTLAFDFNDTALNQILSLDVEREVCLAGIGLTIQPTATADSMAHSQTSSSERSSPKSGLALASRVSSKEVHYEVMTAIHRAGEILPSPRPHPSPSSLPFEIPSNSWRSIANKVTGSGTLAETVLRRRSHRNFVNRPMSKGQFDSMLNLLCQTQAVVTDPGRCANIVTCGCLVGNVTDTLPGFYLLDTTNHKLAQVCAGEYRTKMTAICLDQAWLANAAVHMVLMADLAEVDWVWGPRGYRYAMMTAGRLGHTVYLAATALGLGCCGIGAFYDKEAAQILGLDNNTAMLYLLAVGQIKKSIS
jgi:SagB-type dehydrogenase family enzyme